MTMFHSIWTLLLFLIFIGIVWWAFSGRRKASFDEAANLPLEDDHHMIPTLEDKKNG
jgi:cytochrome c oxidase cbb3-type subunit 4